MIATSGFTSETKLGFELPPIVVGALEGFSDDIVCYSLDDKNGSRAVILVDEESVLFKYSFTPTLVALHGFGRSGKDTFGKILVSEYSFTRFCFGDIIKRQLDNVIRAAFGCSSFSEEHKEKFRRTLEAWGCDNESNITEEYFCGLKGRIVNTRLMRLPEALRWKKAGGVIIWIVRDKQEPATEMEQECLLSMVKARMIDAVVIANSVGAVEAGARIVMSGPRDPGNAN